MKISGVAFDLEGTVVNLEPAHHNAHLMVMKEVGLNVTLEEAIKLCPHFIGGPGNVLKQEIYEASNKTMSVEEIERRDGRYYRELRETMPIAPREGFLEILHYLKETRIGVSIGSLTDKRNALFILEKSGLLGEFDSQEIVLAEDVRELKPASDVFLKTAERMGIPAEEQTVFEDSHNGILAARRAGSLAIGMPVYNRPEAILRLIENGAVRVFMDWREINIGALLENIEAGI